MNTINHAATGAIIALVVDRPILALPLALLSHFALDGLPHNGHSNNGGYVEALKHKLNTYISLIVDFVGLLVLVFLLIGQQWYVFLAMILAVAPDAKWPYRYLFFERKGEQPPELDLISKFHQKIQWCERPWGIFIEVPLAVALILIVWSLI